MFIRGNLLLFVMVVFDNGVMTNILQLSPIQLCARENSSATLTCTKTDGKYILETIWKNSQITSDANLYYHNGQCITTRFLKESDLFSGLCNGDGTYSVILKNIDRTQHGAEWTCKTFLPQLQTSNKVVIQVSVPAWNVDIHSNENIYMRENHKQIISCITSACRPSPTVKWYVKNSEKSIIYDLTEHSAQVYIDEEYGLTSTESNLEFSPNRTIHLWHLFCEVWTRSNVSDIRSKEIVLNVLYPPIGYPVIYGFTNDTVHLVVESELIMMNCSVTGGNPLPTLTMTCFNESSTKVVISNTTVIAYISWKATRYENRCTCESDHVISGKQITYAAFEVMYPPTEVYFSSTGTEQVKGTFVVNQNEVVTFLCLTESNPISDIIIKNYKDEQLALLKNTTVLSQTIREVSCTDAGAYTCSARNLVTRGQGVISTLILIVKCPPSPSADHILQSNITASLNSYAVLEFFAHNYFDVRNRTQFTWYKQNIPLQHGNRKYAISTNGLTSKLIITNLNDTDYGHYKIVVTNSAGQYRHYYTLHKTERDKSVLSSNTGTIIGVAIGTFVFTLLLTASSFIGYKYIRRNRSLQHEETRTSENVSDNQETSPCDDFDANIDKTTVYEQLDDTSKGAQSYMEIQIISTVETSRDYINTTV